MLVPGLDVDLRGGKRGGRKAGGDRRAAPARRGAEQIEPRRVRMMRRVLPIAKDRRPEVYSRIWQTPWSLSHGNFDA